MNVLVVSGNIGKDAVVRKAGEQSVAGFSLAMKSGYGEKAQTIWLDCSLWGKQAEGGLIKFLRKGRLIYVEGELGEKEYNGKKSMTLNISHIDPLFNKNESIDNEVNGGQQGNQGYQNNMSQNNQQPNPYAQQVANKAQGMQGQVNNQFQQQNQNPVSDSNKLYNAQGQEVDENGVLIEIPF